MKIPKTPIAFDYDLWTTEDGKCMVRVKRTGEVSEVDRKVMRILRAEEKRIRRSYGSDNTSEDEDGAEKISDTVLSLTHSFISPAAPVLPPGKRTQHSALRFSA